MTSESKRPLERSSRKLARRPVILTAASLIATSALGLTFGNLVPFAAARPLPASRPSRRPTGGPAELRRHRAKGHTCGR